MSFDLRRAIPLAAIAVLVLGEISRENVALGQVKSAPVAPSPFAGRPVDSYSNAKGVALKWGDVPADDFGPLDVKFDATGLRKLRPAPAPGIHPRILVTPGDREEILQRTRSTRAGQECWKNVLSWSEALRGTYDENAEYAKPDLHKGDYRGSHGRIPMLYYKDKDSVWNPANRSYARLQEGDGTVDCAKLWPVFPIEAMRCWLEGDAPAGQRLARAVVTAMKAEQATRAAKTKAGSAPPAQPVGSHTSASLPFVYDFAFDFMTPEQRKAIHEELAATTWSHDNYGTFTDATGTRSNWTSFSYWLLQLLSIEGEEGFNDLKLAGIYRGWRNFLTYGYYPSGACVEGEAKCQLGMDGVIALARRREPNLAGHPNLRANATGFLPHSVVPTTGGTTVFGNGVFLRYDLLGGVGTVLEVDPIGLKYIYPDDKTIDWMYRKAVGENYEKLPADVAGYWNRLLFATLFATDFDPTNSDAAKLGLGNTFVGGERGLVMTRSSWANDGLFLAMHTRGASGGHAYADRNSITLAGAGRTWCAPNTWREENVQNSGVVIDGRAQGSYAPGRIVDVVDAPGATFVVGDAKNAWDFDYKTVPGSLAAAEAGTLPLPAGYEPERRSFNDFAYTKLPESVFGRQLFLRPGWISVRGMVDAFVRKPNYPVKMAFRTAGVVRGQRPYAIVIDDIRKDDQPHQYDWLMNLEKDVQLVGVTRPRDADLKRGHLFDVTLTGGGSIDPSGVVKKGEPALIVRVLAMGDKPDRQENPQDLEGDAFIAVDASAKGSSRRLVIRSRSVSGGFKVLLYPLKWGDPVPKTTWNDARNSVTVEIGGQKDAIDLSPGSLGKTNVTVTRESGALNGVLARVDKSIQPLPENPK